MPRIRHPDSPRLQFYGAALKDAITALTKAKIPLRALLSHGSLNRYYKEKKNAKSKT